MKLFYKLLVVIILISMLTACNNQNTQILPATKEEAAKIIPAGKEISSKLLSTLKQELTAAIQEKGLKHAVGICNVKALPLTMDLQSENIEIKRTSLKTRNPLNEPDEIEKEALTFYSEMEKLNKPLPEYYIQKVIQNGSSFYYYYQPLKAVGICLACHGSEKDIDPPTLNHIKYLYPTDKATGYKTGEFRGLIRVKFSSI